MFRVSGSVPARTSRRNTRGRVSGSGFRFPGCIFWVSDYRFPVSNSFEFRVLMLRVPGSAPAGTSQTNTRGRVSGSGSRLSGCVSWDLSQHSFRVSGSAPAGGSQRNVPSRFSGSGFRFSGCVSMISCSRFPVSGSRISAFGFSCFSFRLLVFRVSDPRVSGLGFRTGWWKSKE